MMRYVCRLVLPVFLAAVLAPAAAQAADNADELTLTLDGAVNAALKANIGLKKSRIDLDAAAYQADRLWAEVFPALSAKGGVTYSSNLFTAQGFRAEAKGAGYNLSTGVSFSFNAALPARMKAISLAYEQSLLGYEDAKRQLGVQVTRAFFTLIAGRENAANMQESLKLAERQQARTGVLFRSGQGTELDQLNARLRVEQAKSALSGAQITADQQMDEFEGLIGLRAGGRTVILEGEIPECRVILDADYLIDSYLDKRPDILAADLAIRTAENAQRQAAWQSRSPSLALAAEWSGTGAGDKKFSDTLKGSATVTIPVNPWIPGTRESQTIRKANDNLAKARLSYDEKRTNAVHEIRGSVMNVDSARHALNIARLQLNIAEKTYKLSEEGFNSGKVEAQALDSSRIDLMFAQREFLRRKLNSFTALLDLAAALNVDWNVLL